MSPEEPEVTGFVFKVQAYIDPQHRDRIAFVRIASGRFQRGMKLKNIRTGRLMSVQAPVFFLARERNLAEEAWPGEIIGIPNHGILRIGDTLTGGEVLRYRLHPYDHNPVLFAITRWGTYLFYLCAFGQVAAA
jgi:peptide chain release factor 3